MKKKNGASFVVRPIGSLSSCHYNNDVLSLTERSRLAEMLSASAEFGIIGYNKYRDRVVMEQGPPQVFISYSHSDQEWLDRVKQHLAPVVTVCPGSS